MEVNYVFIYMLYALGQQIISLEDFLIWSKNKSREELKVAENGNTQVKHKHLKIVLYSSKCTWLHSITGLQW